MFFFFIPVGVEYQARRYPVMTFSLIGLNTVIFLTWFIQRVSSGGGWDESGWYESMWLIPATSPWYAWITTLFVHAGFLHLIGNMVYLFLFGSPVEDMMGRWQFLVFYLLGGLASDFAYVGLTADHFASDIPLGGASGAISACMGAFAFLLFRRKIEFKWVFLVIFIFRIFTGDFFLPAWLIMSFWFLQDLVSALLSFSRHGGGVAFGGHVGGFVGGALLILLVKYFWQCGLMHRADEESDALTVRASSPQAAIFYIYENGNQIGPFTMAQVRQMLRLGSVRPDSWYWCEGMSDWQSLSDLVGER